MTRLWPGFEDLSQSPRPWLRRFGAQDHFNSHKHISEARLSILEDLNHKARKAIAKHGTPEPTN